MRTFVALLLLSPLPLAAQTLDSIELAQLDRYLATLKSGGLASASQVEALADISFVGLERIMTEYADLAEPIEPHSHRAWQALLERTSRSALLPWPMIQLYSSQFGRFQTAPTAENPLARRLFLRLVSSGGDRRSLDLAVRLAPGPALEYLAVGTPEHRLALLEAWNRRLGRGEERRPIDRLDMHVGQIARSFSIELPDREPAALLAFMASWPSERELYHQGLAWCLRSNRAEVVLSGLAVQQRVPALLAMNEEVVHRFAGDAKIVETALRNYAYDDAEDHSAILRRLWGDLKPEQTKARFHCLFAMGAHPRGNDGIALAAVLEQPYELLDVAVGVLAAGDPQKARRAIQHVLTQSKRGHEEVLRLADRMALAGFEDQAVTIALDAGRDQILRQAALLYLRRADGQVRRRLLSFLQHASADLRLTAIQMFAPPAGLSSADKEEIGPALIRVALHDTSPGHRQEAIHALGEWRDPQAADLFRKILTDNRPAEQRDGQVQSEPYWPYRLRLVSLLALAKLKEASARAELLDLHRRGGPTERMDVLLAFSNLGEVPDGAFDDLRVIEPKLVATAAELIAEHGDAAARQRLHAFFQRSPLWQEFQDSGIDDHNLLHIAESASIEPSGRRVRPMGREEEREKEIKRAPR